MEKENKIKQWEAYWPQLQQTTKETENHIDKKVYGISAGGIGIEIASLQFINNVGHKLLAFISGLLFVITLVLNLFSHVRSLKSQEKECNAIQDFFDDETASDDSYIYNLIHKENRTLYRINNVSICTMLIAIITLLSFIISNV